MKNVTKIRTYFDIKSSLYQKKSDSFPWSIIRKFEKKIILSLLGNTKNLSIVDVGSGSGFYTSIIYKNNPKELYAIDNSSKMLLHIKEKQVVKILQNIETLKLHKKFDKLICAGLLEFTSKPTIVMKNINKIAKKDAILILLYPKNNFLGKIYQKFHVSNKIKINLFTKTDILKIIKNSKWKLLKEKNFLFSSALKLKKNK